MTAPSGETGRSYRPAPAGFNHPLDAVFAIIAETILAGMSVGLVVFLNRLFTLARLETIFFFWFALMLFTLLGLKLIRITLPIKPGIYSYQTREPLVFAWVLSSFLYNTNLGLFYNYPNLLPSPLRTLFYKCLGAKIADGALIFGKISDPSLVCIGENCIVGAHTWLLPHVLTRKGGENVLILGRIHLENSSLIGASTLILPDTIVGKGAIVRVMSYLPMRTRVPEGEFWGGNPAGKIK
jgi:acetyltransferase-like isoleucine patch superfamily enzyme